MSLTWPATISQPSLQMPTTVKNNALVSPVVNGTKITRLRHTRQLSAWKLQWNAMPDTELIILRQFFATTGGSAADFTWVDEFGNTFTVRFAEGNIEHVSVSGTHSQVSLELEEK